MLGSFRRVLTFQPCPQPQQNMSVQTLKIIPKLPSFFIDDYIEGQIEMTASMQVLINDINLVLNCGQSWVTFSKELNTNINEKRTEAILTMNLDVKRKLNINSNLVALKAGKYNFGFKFKIPNEINPSFEYPLEVEKSSPTTELYFTSIDELKEYSFEEMEEFIKKLDFSNYSIVYRKGK